MKILISSIVDLTKSAHNRPHRIVEHLSKQHIVHVISINDFWKEKFSTHKEIEFLKEVKVFKITNLKISPLFQEFFAPFFINNFLKEHMKELIPLVIQLMK